MVLLGLEPSAGMTGLGFQGDHSHVWWVMLAVA